MLYQKKTHKSLINKPITKITQNSDGSISFFYVAGAIPATVATEATNVAGNSFTANWEARQDALSYTLQVNPKPDVTLLMSETKVS